MPQDSLTMTTPKVVKHIFDTLAHTMPGHMPLYTKPVATSVIQAMVRLCMEFMGLEKQAGRDRANGREARKEM